MSFVGIMARESPEASDGSQDAANSAQLEPPQGQVVGLQLSCSAQPRASGDHALLWDDQVGPLHPLKSTS